MMTLTLRRTLRYVGYLFPGWAGFRFKVLGVLLFLVGALVGLALTFPSSVVERGLINLIEQQAQVRLDEGSLKIGFFRLYGEDMLLRSQAAEWFPLEVDALEVTPRWLSLLSLNPALHFELQLWGGSLQGDLSRDGMLAASAKNLKLDLPLRQGGQLSLGGTLIQAIVDTQIPLQEGSASRVEMTLEEGYLRVLGQSVSFGTLVLKATGRGEVFLVPTLVASGGDYAVSGGGNVLVKQQINDSRLNLRVEIRPQTQADPGLTELLGMVATERSDGSFQLRIRGPLSQLQMK
jgi:type II secretion system protein N